jgi:hypothetical protein
MNENGSGDGGCASKSVPTSIPALTPTPTLMLTSRLEYRARFKGRKHDTKRFVGQVEDVGEVGEFAVFTEEETRSSLSRTVEVASPHAR